MLNPVFNPDIQNKLSYLDFIWNGEEWVTKVGYHRLVEIIVAYFSGYRYFLNKFNGRDYRISTILKTYPYLRKRKDDLPSNHRNIQFKWDQNSYWLVESNKEVFMLHQK